jgi:hypothetical protein
MGTSNSLRRGKHLEPGIENIAMERVRIICETRAHELHEHSQNNGKPLKKSSFPGQESHFVTVGLVVV